MKHNNHSKRQKTSRYYWYFIVLLWGGLYTSQVWHGVDIIGSVDAASVSLLLVSIILISSIGGNLIVAFSVNALLLFNLTLVIGNRYYFDFYQSFAPFSIISLLPGSLPLINTFKPLYVGVFIIATLLSMVIIYQVIRRFLLPGKLTLSSIAILSISASLVLQLYHDQRQFKLFSAVTETPLGYFLRTAGLVPFIVGSPYAERMANIDAFANGINKGVTYRLPQDYLVAVKRFFPEKTYTNSLYPLLSNPQKVDSGQTTQELNGKTNSRSNIIVIVLESFRASESGMYGNNVSATPFLDSLSNKALWARNFYANAPRTAKSETAINCGVLDFFGGLSLSERETEFSLSCIPDILRKFGYETLWFHGNDKDFYKRAKHLPKQGFTKAYGIEDLYGSEYKEKSPSINKPAFEPKPILGWGIPDPVLFDIAITRLEKLKKPFYAEILSVSNHFPFNYEWGIPFPEYLQAQDTPYNRYRRGLYYADQALKEFVEKFNNSPLYENTVVLVTGDHGFWVFDENSSLSNINKYEQFFRVPLLIYGKNITSGVIEQAASHVDIPPTILSILGINTTTAFMGQSLIEPPRTSAPIISLLETSYGFRLNNAVCTPNRCFRNTMNSCSRDKEQQQEWRKNINISCFLDENNLMFDMAPQETTLPNGTIGQIDGLLNYLMLGLKIGITPKTRSDITN